MNSREQQGTTKHARARRLLACFLAVLFVVQPIARALPACSIGALIPGGRPCCCANSSTVQGPSCCSSADIGRGASGASLSSVGRCACEVQTPEPIPALPLESGVRGVDGVGDSCLDRWIGAGALASASTPILEWASLPGEACGALIRWPCVLPDAPAPRLARGVRGLLAVICVARC